MQSHATACRHPHSLSLFAVRFDGAVGAMLEALD